MKNLNFVIFAAIFCLLSPVFSANDSSRDSITFTRNAFERMMEFAHPTPILQKQSAGFLPNFLSATPNESSFDNENLIENETDPLPIQNESSIAVNPKNPKNLIASAVDYRDNSSSWVYVSQDGGRTWKNINLGKPYVDWTAGNDPSVAFDADGNGYLCYGAFPRGIPAKNGENGVFISKTTDGGLTWQKHIPVIQHNTPATADTAFEDKYYISIDNSPSSPYFKTLYIPWKRVTAKDSATQIVLSRSVDGGMTWSAPVPVSNRIPGFADNFISYGQSYPIATTGPNGELNVAWNHGPLESIGFAKSTDGGKTFSAPTTVRKYNPMGIAATVGGDTRYRVKGVVRANTYPSLACDISTSATRGNLYLTWAAEPIPNVYFSKSIDAGTSWSAPVIVHSDTTNDQFWQWLSVDQTNGNLAVMYDDSRDDSLNLAVNCYVSYSNDAGKTWIDRRVSDISFDLRQNPFAGNVFAGDYSGNAFHNGIIYPSWMDSRNGSPDDDVFTAIINTKSPNPVKNFKATIFANKPSVVSLSWTPPTERVFGQKLLSSEFQHVIFRNGQFLASLPGTTANFTDTGLNAHDSISYSIVAVAGTDTSAKRFATAFPGGAKNPNVPVLLNATGNNDNSVNLSVKIPTFRADSTTPLVNVLLVKIYREGKFVLSQKILSSDTGKTLTVIDTSITERGFYHFRVSVADSSGNESAQSNEELLLYTGVIGTYLYETFDEPVLPKYLFAGDWTVNSDFSFSKPNSLKNTSATKYRGSEKDTLTLFPIERSNKVGIAFSHAAIIDPTDTAYVDISWDDMKTWQILKAYNKSDNFFWQDGTRDINDWVQEKFSLIDTGKSSNYRYIRFRFSAGAFKNDDGWYLDDIHINSIGLGVNESNAKSKNLTIFPNPASSHLTIFSETMTNLAFQELVISDMLGQRIVLPESSVHRTDTSIEVDIHLLSQGVYVAEIGGQRSMFVVK